MKLCRFCQNIYSLISPITDFISGTKTMFRHLMVNMATTVHKHEHVLTRHSGWSALSYEDIRHRWACMPWWQCFYKTSWPDQSTSDLTLLKICCFSTLACCKFNLWFILLTLAYYYFSNTQQVIFKTMQVSIILCAFHLLEYVWDK